MSYLAHWLTVGSVWKSASGWQPSDARVQVTELAGGRVYFKDATGDRCSSELDLSETVFLEGYVPAQNEADTTTPSLF
jgi:hypothetical protein